MKKLTDYLFNQDFDTDWHMTPAERMALIHVLQISKPKLSIEIGTFRAGSLRPISHYSDQVITFDIDPNQHRIAPEFPNTKFITGDTSITLPGIIDEINKDKSDLGFVLIDGSHEADGVRQDTNNILKYIPQAGPCFVLFHDSSNPKVREGILACNYAESKHLHILDVDFVPGKLYSRPDIHNQIWGGIGIAILLPTERKGELVPDQSFEYSLSKLKTEKKSGNYFRTLSSKISKIVRKNED